MADGLLNKASIILTPTGYKAGTLYNVAPIDEPYEDFDFARTSTATRINSSGLVSNVATGVPRISYDSNGDNGHILLEPTSTNLVPYSEDFSEWSSTEVSTDKNYTSPDGTLNAVKITDNSVDSTHRVRLLTTTASSGDFTYSVFLKKGTMTDAVLNVYSNGTKAVATIDLENGTITASGGGVNAKIEDYGNDWYRCSIGGTLASTATTVYLYLSDSKNAYVGNGDFLYMYGAQLEALSYATSYIPTLTGSTETRATETATGAGSADLINSTEGVLYAEINALSYPTDLNSWLTITDGTASNSVGIVFETTPLIVGRVEVGGVNQAYLANNVDYSDFVKVAVKYKANDFALWINGVEVATDTSGNTFSANTLNSLQFSYGGGTNNWKGKVKALAVFNEALSDSELTQLTT